MKKLNADELRSIDGGYSTTCPTCGKKVSVSFLSVWFYGKQTAYTKARAEAMGKHTSIWGYKRNVKHY